jgi:hypothetical protein
MKPGPIGLALIATVVLARPVQPQSRVAPADEKPAAEAARASKMAADELKRWEVRIGDDPGRLATTHPDSVLRYSNPSVGRVYGDVFLFIADGRPEAVMSIFKFFTPWTGFEAEMHSLSASPMKAQRDGQVVWQPDRPGIELKDVPDAPAPGVSSVERLGQMRSIAGGFAGHLLDARVQATGEDQSLRLLPKPLYRYQPKDPALRDGALFAFVLGTDPEFFVLLEAKETPRGPRWQYGLARMNDDALQVTYKGKAIWKVDKVARRRDSRAPYFSIILPQPPPTP